MHETPSQTNSLIRRSELRVEMSDSDGGNRQGGSQQGGNQQGGSQPGGPPPLPPNRGGRQVFGWVLAAFIIALLIMAFSSPFGGQKEVKWSDFVNLVKAKSIEPESVVIEGSRVTAKVKPNTPGWSSEKGAQPVFVVVIPDQDYYRKDIEAAGYDFKVVEPSYWPIIIANLLPVILIIGVIWFIARSMRGAGGGPGGMLGNFGKSRHRVQTKEQVKVTFGDVAGVDEAKEEVQEIVEFLKNPKRFSRLGGRIPRGVLLSGPPGCGKTLLAKAIAGEADVPFFSISGSDFVEMFVGVGASRVRDLFKQAKENSPCIIFLDEIDAVGRRRGGGFSSGGHDEREQTLNAILVEMDGFDANTQVIVIASTNRPDVLDPALTRPGRFDRQVAVNLPDLVGRRQILAVHAKKVKLAPDVDLETVARGTPMFSGADLAALINEAAIIATMVDKDFVELADLEEARDKVRWGRANKSRKIEQQERVATAYHEAGHAVLQVLLEHADPLHKVTIIPRGRALGVTMSLPEGDQYSFHRKEALDMIAMTAGGRIAEEIFVEDFTTGASNDIKQMTRLARKMVCEWGMSDKLGMVEYGEHEDHVFLARDMGRARDYSEATAQEIDREVRRFVDEGYARAKALITQHRDKVELIAKALLEYETLDGDQVKELIETGTMKNPPYKEKAPPPLPPPPAETVPEPPESIKPEFPSGGFPAPAPA